MDLLEIKSLERLLNPQDENSDIEEDMPDAGFVTKMGPGDVGPRKKARESKIMPKENTKDIWDEDEIQPGAEFDDLHDTRPQPEYDLLYKQAIATEDMFLGMNNKTPATSSCEDMVVKIKLPDTKIADVKLDVKEKFLDCRTPKYKLGLHLPNPVDHQKGKAQWEAKTETLIVTLRMCREYDFVNF